MCTLSSVILSLGLVGSRGFIHSVFIYRGPVVDQEVGVSLHLERVLAFREPIG